MTITKLMTTENLSQRQRHAKTNPNINKLALVKRKQKKISKATQCWVDIQTPGT